MILSVKKCCLSSVLNLFFLSFNYEVTSLVHIARTLDEDYDDEW